MYDIDSLAVEAKTNEHVMNQLIVEHQSYLLKRASLLTRKYITTSDDEWSIVMQAFVEAIHQFDRTRGHFLNLANLIIQRRLTDYYRSQAKHHPEITMNPAAFESRGEEEDQQTFVQSQITKKIIRHQEDGLKLEIQIIAPILQAYGFSFFDLVDHSPKAGKTKHACIEIITFLLKSQLLLTDMRATKQLPIKIIEKNVGIPRKIIERHRKYIIAVVEMLSGEFPYLAEYVSTMKEESNR
jgi:RNA polymerase sigma factor